MKMDNPRAALEPLRRAIDIFLDARDMSALALILDVAGIVMIGEDEQEKAAYLIGVGHRIKSDTGVAIGEVDVNQYPEVHDFLKNMDDAEQAAYEEGYNANVEEAAQLVRTALDESRS